MDKKTVQIVCTLIMTVLCTGTLYPQESDPEIVDIIQWKNDVLIVTGNGLYTADSVQNRLVEFELDLESTIEIVRAGVKKDTLVLFVRKEEDNYVYLRQENSWKTYYLSSEEISPQVQLLIWKDEVLVLNGVYLYKLTEGEVREFKIPWGIDHKFLTRSYYDPDIPPRRVAYLYRNNTLYAGVQRGEWYGGLFKFSLDKERGSWQRIDFDKAEGDFLEVGVSDLDSINEDTIFYSPAVRGIPLVDWNKKSLSYSVRQNKYVESEITYNDVYLSFWNRDLFTKDLFVYSDREVYLLTYDSQIFILNIPEMTVEKIDYSGFFSRHKYESILVDQGRTLYLKTMDGALHLFTNESGGYVKHVIDLQDQL